MKEFFENQDSRRMYMIAFGIFLLCFLIFHYSFKNGQPTCNRFIMNTYLYIALGLSILGTVCYLFDFYKIDIGFGPFLFIFILTLGIIIYIHFVSPKKNILLNHILWLLLIVCFGLTLSPLTNNELYKPYIFRTIQIVMFIFFFMSLVVYLFPNFFLNTYSTMMMGLFVALIVIIIIEVIKIIYKGYTNNWEMTNVDKGISYFVIVLFSLFVSYDTTTLKIRSKNCKESSIFLYPNYPVESLNIILDLLNLFVRVLGLQGNQ
jgi:FtsH-binding integral membrane protein